MGGAYPKPRTTRTPSLTLGRWRMECCPSTAGRGSRSITEIGGERLRGAVQTIKTTTSDHVVYRYCCPVLRTSERFPKRLPSTLCDNSVRDTAAVWIQPVGDDHRASRIWRVSMVGMVSMVYPPREGGGAERRGGERRASDGLTDRPTISGPLEGAVGEADWGCLPLPYGALTECHRDWRGEALRSGPDNQKQQHPIMSCAGIAVRCFVPRNVSSSASPAHSVTTP